MKQLQNCLRCCDILRKLTLSHIKPLSCQHHERRSTHTMSAVPHRTCLRLLSNARESTQLLQHLQSRGSRSTIGIGQGQSGEGCPVNPASGTTSKKDAVLDTAWVLRLANENGYLSWCRNTYLASGVACGMQAEATFEISQVAAHGVFLLAGLNLTWGTISFVTLVIELRRRVHMSAFTATLNVTGATLHLLAWLMLVTMYLGITEEPPVEVGSDDGDRV